MEKRIDSIFIDLGNTFRIILKNEVYIKEAMTRIVTLLGAEAEPEAFYRDVIEPRYDRYREWALKYYCEAPESVLWTRWLAYDFPKARVEAAASELCWCYRRCKGERVVTDGGTETIRTLYDRGYTLGIISDLVGIGEVDDWLNRERLKPYFKTVQQSSVCLVRKPHPAIYYYALAEAGSAPEHACYVGDNLERDICGAKAVGFGMTVGVRYPGLKHQAVTAENRPDHFITHFSQLNTLFPPLR